MKCPKCGIENNESNKFCQGCGTPLQTSSQKPKKAWYKRWWIWLLMGLGTIMLLFNATCTCALLMPSAGQASDYRGKASSSDVSKPKETDKATEPTTEPPTQKPTEKVTEKPTEKPTQPDTENQKQAYIDSCKTIDFATLARNPDKYKGEHFKFTGKVIQVLESDSWFSDATTLRVNVTQSDNEYLKDFWEDTIVCTVTIPKGADRILEDDIITFYGDCDGLYTYTAILGQNVSLPKIDIRYYNIQ